MTNSKLKIVKKRNSIKIYNLNKGIYYFRVRGIKGKIKGKWSKIRKVTLDSDNIDVINQINSKYNLKLSLNAKLINYEIDKLNINLTVRNMKVVQCLQKYKFLIQILKKQIKL